MLDRSSEKRTRRTRGRPTREAVADIEQELLIIALQEFLRNGYGATSMSQIARRAHVSKTTLYTRYPSKEDLFRAILDRQLEKLVKLNDMQAKVVNLGLREGLITYTELTLIPILSGEMLDTNRLILTEFKTFPELGVAARQRTESGVKRLAAFISQCAANDGVPCTNPMLAARTFMYMHRGWYFYAILSNEPILAEDAHRWIVEATDLFLLGRANW